MHKGAYRRHVARGQVKRPRTPKYIFLEQVQLLLARLHHCLQAEKVSVDAFAHRRFRHVLLVCGRGFLEKSSLVLVLEEEFKINIRFSHTNT